MCSAEPFTSVMLCISALLASAIVNDCAFFFVFPLRKAKNRKEATMSLKLCDAVESSPDRNIGLHLRQKILVYAKLKAHQHFHDQAADFAAVAMYSQRLSALH